MVERPAPVDATENASWVLARVFGAVAIAPVVGCFIAATVCYVCVLPVACVLIFFNEWHFGCLIAILVNAIIARANFRKYIWQQGNLKLPTINPPKDRLRSGPDGCHIRTGSYWRFLFWLTMPGILGILTVGTMGLFNGFGWSDVFTKTGLSYLFLFLPLSLTIRISSLLQFREFHGTDAYMYYYDKRCWHSMATAQIRSVTIERNSEIPESAYHEDDETQHALVIKGESSSFRINLDGFDDKDRRRICTFLNNNIDNRLISLPARELLRSGEVSPTSQKNISVNDDVDDTSFTAMWQNELNAHISRTNYVPLEVGQALQNGRYQVSGFLSSGGFCTTYICDTTSGEQVVIKESSMPAGLPAEQRELISEMFTREAKLLQRCKHEKIATILDHFQENDREYLVLKLIDGIPLSRLIRSSTPVNEQRAVDWAIQLAGFLEHLHELNPPIIHRDFTPENLLLHRSGELYLIDFGAANEFIGQATGTLIGKQAYMPLEQLQGKATPQSDIYALGCTMYFLLSGKDPVPLSESHPHHDGIDCTDELDTLIGECTRQDAATRVGSAGELRERLQELLQTLAA